MRRKEMDERFQWDLTHIYPDTAHWEDAMKQAAKDRGVSKREIYQILKK